MNDIAKIWHRCRTQPWLSAGWLVVLAHAVGNVRVGWAYPNFILYADLYFLLLGAVGLICQWGLAVQFTLAGWCITQYWRLFGSVSSGYMESVWQDLIDPAICAGLGLLLGTYAVLVQRNRKN